MIMICVAPLNDFDSVMSRAKRGFDDGAQHATYLT